MTLPAAQYFYAAPDRVTSYSIMIDSPNDLDAVNENVISKVTEEYEVMTWDLMNKEMVQAIQSDNVGGIIMLAILYMVIGFGVFGTVMMMTMERRKEFAIMIAIGMQKTKLFAVTIIETMLIGIIAIIFGVLLSYPLLLYYYHNPIELTGAMADAMKTFGVEPILPFSLDTFIFINQSITVVFITIIAIIYPLSIILRFDILKGMRS
jgi:ABC-type lipoprotein release transport system permease subunit